MAQCPLTGREIAKPFLVRRSVPTNQNKLFSDQEAARTMPRGDLELYVCPDTGFIWNAAFDSSIVDYGSLYENTQSASPSFQVHLDALCDQLVNDHQVRNCHILEVGCGKGGFLKQLILYPGANNTGIGFDTSYNGPLESCDGRLTFHRSYYDHTQAHISVDVLICRHVIEHIQDPVAFLRELHRTLEKQPQVRLFFETPTVEWILQHQVSYDFFYEHCSYFTPASLTTAFEMAGFQVDNVQLVFGGQYQWLSASLPSQSFSSPSMHAGNCVALADAFAAEERTFLSASGRRLQKLAAEHTVAVWGAGAKGVTFCNLLDPNAEWIDCVIDLNAEKQQKYLPGTGHPIVAPAALRDRGVTVAINMNPNYHAENCAIIRTNNLPVDLCYICPPYPPEYETYD